MENSAWTNYGPVIGQNVEYIKPSLFGLRKAKYTGLLVDIKCGDKKGKMTAVVQRVEHNYETPAQNFWILDEVPIENILEWKRDGNKLAYINDNTPTHVQPYFDDPESGSDQAPATAPPLSIIEDDFENDMYTATTTDSLKIGDEVVWLHEYESTLIGRVTFIGERVLPSEKPDIIAIVQFDQPTNKLPRYLSQPPDNRNMVSINDLLLLSVWLEPHSM